MRKRRNKLRQQSEGNTQGMRKEDRGSTCADAVVRRRVKGVHDRSSIPHHLGPANTKHMSKGMATKTVMRARNLSERLRAATARAATAQQVVILSIPFSAHSLSTRRFHQGRACVRSERHARRSQPHGARKRFRLRIIQNQATRTYTEASTKGTQQTEHEPLPPPITR